MQRKLSDTLYVAAKVAGICLLGLVFGILLESCSDHMSQVYSPTSPLVNSESVGSGSKKGAVGKDTVSSIVPNIPPPGGVGYMQGSQYIADYYQFDGVYLPEDANKGKYLVLVGIPPNSDYTSMYSKYCFRRAVETSDQIGALLGAGFQRDQIIVQLGWRNDDRTWEQVLLGEGTVTYSMVANWQHTVTDNAQSVLGFWMDEPSGLISADSMQYIADFIHNAGGKLWIEDYDTGPVEGTLNTIVHNYHLADLSMLSKADFISNNGNTSELVSGDNPLGINVLAADYNEFQFWFVNTFCCIEAQAMDKNGDLYNDGTMINWLTSYPNINNFALAVGSSNNAIDGDYPAAVLASLPNFVNDADRAGFLGHQYQVYSYTYTCQTNDVDFTPPNSPSSGAGSSSYWGVWTNNSYYAGPVNPGTTGATLCWVLQSTNPTNLTVNTY